MLQHWSFIIPKNDHRLMGSSLCKEFVCEVYTISSVSGPISRFTISPKGPRKLFLQSMSISKSQKCYKSNLNGLTVRLVDFGHDFFGLILVVLAAFMMSRVQF